MSESAWAHVPQGAQLKPKPFRVAVPDQDVEELKTLLRLSRITAPTFESTREDNRRKQESRINAFPQFIVDVPYRGRTFAIHFIALFSSRADAPALIAGHGWPGSFFEFVPLCETLAAKYTPSTIPFSLIIPSLPGYGWSARPPVDHDFVVQDVADIFDNLMNGLGFKNGYIAQGGDLSSAISRMLLQKPNCRAAHFNMLQVGPPSDWRPEDEDDRSRANTAQRSKWFDNGSAYAQEHKTRPATIGFVLSSNPASLLAWVMEKVLEWTDTSPPIDEILTLVSLHWFTDSIATSTYLYRQLMDQSRQTECTPPLTKPFALSYFPHELFVTPRSWVEAAGNLRFYREHDRGGHFAAWEQNRLLLGDMEDFVKQIWA